jgi:hypothetical protein
MKKVMLMVGVMLVIGCVVRAVTLTDVSSHSTPSLVDEINTTFAEVEAAFDAGVSNATAIIYARTVRVANNGVFTLGTNVTVTFGANSALASSSLAYSTPYTTQTVAGVFTNVYDSKGLNVSHNP